MRFRQLKRSILIGSVVVLALLIVGVVTFPGSLWWVSNLVSPPDLALISDCTHISFPKSARVVKSKLDKYFQGGTLWAKVEMDRGDVDGFLRALPKGVTRSRNRRILELSNQALSGLSRPGWWDPDSARSFEAVLLRRIAPLCGVVVSLDDHRRATIYLVYST